MTTGTATHPPGDGNSSRTFLWQGSINWKVPDGGEIGGAGWYSSVIPNECLFRIREALIGVPFYYDSLRITSNAPSEHVTTIPETFVMMDCPFPIEPTHQVGTSEANVFASPEVSQNHLMCAEVVVTCGIEDDTAEWYLHVCEDLDNITFGGVGEHGISSIPIGSHTIDCQGPGDPVASYNVTEYLNPESRNQTSEDGPLGQIHIDQLVPPDIGSAYVVSCYTVDYVLFPPGTPATAESHDWFLVLTEENRTQALQTHLGPGTLPGLYDLAGDNGCPFPPTTNTLGSLPSKEDPLVPLD